MGTSFRMFSKRKLAPFNLLQRRSSAIIKIVNVEAISADHEAFIAPFKLLQRRPSAIVKTLMSKPFQPRSKAMRVVMSLW